MANTITFQDTYKAVETLVHDAGLSERAAKAIVQTITQAEVKDAPATKSDLAEMETRLFTRIVMWVVGLAIGQFVATVGTLAAIYSMFA